MHTLVRVGNMTESPESGLFPLKYFRPKMDIVWTENLGVFQDFGSVPERNFERKLHGFVQKYINIFSLWISECKISCLME